MKIGFACDHAAVDLKNTLLEYLKGKGYECVGARVVGDELAKAIVDAFFGATFQGGRHAERVQIIKDMEAELYKPEAL